jgi:aspartate-semialdehyde dehydrogenase
MVTIGILGATGLVGRALLKQFEEQSLGDKFYLFASDRSVGQEVWCRHTAFPILAPTKTLLDRCDILLAVTDGAISKALIQERQHQHLAIIDNASTFRMEQTVPLLIPEINAHDYHGETLLANPNCTTIQLLLALDPIIEHIGIKECFVSTYQSVSGTGSAAMDELTQGMKAILDDKDPSPVIYPQPIAANVIPQCDSFIGDWTLEELKIIQESQKILRTTIKMHPTCVRVPVYQGHHLSVTLKLHDKINKNQLQELIQLRPRLRWCDHQYPMAKDFLGTDSVFISRARHALDDLNTWSFWLSADNIRVGAATNAINILKLVLSLA